LYKSIASRIGAFFLSLLLLATLFPLNAFAMAASTPISSKTEPVSVRLFENVSGSGTWEATRTPQHFNVDENKVVYCLEHKKGNPRNNNTYSIFSPTDTYPTETYQGLYSILTFGYPAGGNGGLTDDQARYATANAIRYWLAEQQAKHGMDFQQYNFSQLSRNRARAKQGDATAQKMWDYCMDLVNKARNRTTLAHKVSLSNPNMEMKRQGDQFVGQTTVTLVNCSGGYTYTAPANVSVSGYTGKSGDTLTISVPLSMANQTIRITFTGKDNRNTANYGWYAPTNDDQKVVLVDNSLMMPAVTSTLKMTTPATGKIRIHKVDADTGTDTPQGDAELTGAKFEVLDGDGNVVDTLSLENTTTATSKDLPFGDYIVKETDAGNNGYLLNAQEYPVSIGANDSTTDIYPVTIANTVIKGQIALTKFIQGDHPNNNIKVPLEGRTFTFTLKSTGEVLDTQVTDENGYCISKPLPYATVIVTETDTGDPAIAPIQPFEVVIDTDQKVYAYILEDFVYQSEIKVVKIDATTGKTISAAGNKFKIRNEGTGEWVVMHQRYPVPKDIDVFETADNGTFVLPEPLPYGQYSLHEQAASAGYLLNPTPVFFEVTNDHPVVEIKFPNQPVMGKICLTKKGPVFAGTQEEKTEFGTVIRPVFQDQKVAGCVYEVRAKTDIVTPDGTVRLRAGELADTLVTETEKEVLSVPLYLGEYQVKEISVGDNELVLNPTVYDVTLSHQDQTTAIVLEHLDARNDRPATELLLEKQAEVYQPDDSSIETKPGAGFVFGLFASEDIHGVGNTVLQKGALVAVGVTQADGRLSITSDLPYGHYEFRELHVPSSYYPLHTVFPVDLSYPGSDTSKVTVQVNQGEPILNKLVTGRIRIIKEDTRKPEDLPEDDLSYRIEGATFTIQNDALGLSYELVTDETGVALSPLIPCGEWTIFESNPAAGYLLSNERQVATIDADTTETLTFTFQNSPTEVVLTKTDLTTGVPVPGATIEIYDAAGNMVFTDVTSETGQVHAFQLPAGAQYTFRETLAPNGHALNPKSFSFEIRADGTVSGVTEFTDDVSRIRILKIDAVTKKPLPGVSFGLYNQAGEQLQIQKTDKNGIAEFIVEQGMWKLIETSALDGYTLSGKVITVEVGPDYVNGNPIVVENAPIVQTGVDSGSPWMFLALAGLCGISGLLVILHFRKRNRR
jgi:uncharacterized surface anchored protein